MLDHKRLHLHNFKLRQGFTVPQWVAMLNSGSASYRSGRSTASRAGAGWSFQPPPEPKKLIDHNAHTQKHQYDDDGGLHLLIIPRGLWGRVLFRPPFAPRPRDGVSSGLDGLFSAHVGDKGWLHPLPLRGEPRGQP